MSRRRTEWNAPHVRGSVLARAFIAMLLGVASIAFFPAAVASAATSSIGVFVDNPPPTTAPPAPTPTAAPPPANNNVKTPTPPTTLPVTTTVPNKGPASPSTQATLPDVLPPPTTAKAETGIVVTAKKFADGTKKVVKDVLSGKPVADALETVLPEGAAEVVVPAVRTASTFAFPIGLAGAVLAFLALQQRIDAGDPKLTAAPLAHDNDEVEFL